MASGHAAQEVKRGGQWSLHEAAPARARGHITLSSSPRERRAVFGLGVFAGPVCRRRAAVRDGEVRFQPCFVWLCCKIRLFGDVSV